NPATGLSCGKPGCTPTALKGRPVLSCASQNECEHGRQMGKCGDCEYQDLLGELSDIRDERDALKAELDRLPAKWSEDSSLQTWFPITSEELESLRAENTALKAELNDTKAAADDFFNDLKLMEEKIVDCQKSLRELKWENDRLKAELEAKSTLLGEIGSWSIVPPFCTPQASQLITITNMAKEAAEPIYSKIVADIRNANKARNEAQDEAKLLRSELEAAQKQAKITGEITDLAELTPEFIAKLLDGMITPDKIASQALTQLSELPEHPLRDSMSSHHRCYAEGWNKCRAAIISGDMPAWAKGLGVPEIERDTTCEHSSETKKTIGELSDILYGSIMKNHLFSSVINSSQETDAVLAGDYFTHERMGTRFYCSKVVRDESGNIESIELVDSAEKIPDQRKKAEK
ncbi:MAG TPA: hypothetical protein PK011_04295, partial [Marinagarivorans sp.]|nr:hypothetical protein [Marinagarivorans sp.]